MTKGRYMSNVKVLLIAALPPPVGGDSTWSEKYIEYCNNFGYPISIVNTSVIGMRAQNVEGASSVLEELKRALGIWKNIWQEVSIFKPDIVHMNTNCSPKGIIRDYISALILVMRRVPCIIHCHCNVQDQLGESKIGRYYFRKLIAKSQAIIVLNSASQNYVNSNNDKKAVIIPNFIDAEYIKNENKNVSKSINNILFVGHIRKSKGIDEIIEVAKHYPQKAFILAGPITKEIDEMCVPSNVEMIGSQNPEQVKMLLDATDVFLFPSYTEGFAVSLLEAMARGLPCIASNVGANKDMIEKEGGIIVPARDTESIISAIRILENQNLRRDISKWNIQKVKANYTIDVVFDKLWKLYIQGHK